MICSISGKIGSGKDTFAKMLQAVIATERIIPLAWLDHLKERPWEAKDNTLPHLSGYQIKKFSGALKQIVAILIGCTVEQLEDRDFKDSTLSKEWWYTDYGGDRTSLEDTIQAMWVDSGMRAGGQYPTQEWIESVTIKPTVRQLLQEVGTNAIREVIHPNAWINALFAQYKQTGWNTDKYPEMVPKYPNWIITDTRFPNEADAVKQRGGILIRLERINKTEAMVRDIMGATLSPLSSSAMHPSETALDSYTFDEVVPNQGTLDELYSWAKIIVKKYNLA